MWDCLHDAELRSLQSDTLERTVVLDFDVPHLREHHALPPENLFRFVLHAVTAVRAMSGNHWPGPKPEVAGKSGEERSRLVREYMTKGRVESVAWSQFEIAVAATSFDILEASFVADEEEVALHLAGVLDGESWYNLFIHAQRLVVSRSDGVDVDLARFRALGEAYWKAFATGQR